MGRDINQNKKHMWQGNNITLKAVVFVIEQNCLHLYLYVFCHEAVEVTVCNETYIYNNSIMHGIFSRTAQYT